MLKYIFSYIYKIIQLSITLSGLCSAFGRPQLPWTIIQELLLDSHILNRLCAETESLQCCSRGEGAVNLAPSLCATVVCHQGNTDSGSRSPFTSQPYAATELGLLPHRTSTPRGRGPRITESPAVQRPPPLIVTACTVDYTSTQMETVETVSGKEV
jgi:hypothetical protein